MIGLSVIVVYFFTNYRKWQPRIPIHADWNAIPIEEIIHNRWQTFFHFFLIFFSAIAVRAKKGDHAAQISWQRQREKSPGVVVIRCAVKNGCDHRRSSAAATLSQLWGGNSMAQVSLNSQGQVRLLARQFGKGW